MPGPHATTPKPQAAPRHGLEESWGVHYILGAIRESEARFGSAPLRVSQPVHALQACFMVNSTGWNAGNGDARL